MKTKSIIAAFMAKFIILKRNLEQKEYKQFPNLLITQKNDEDLHTYCEHFETLHLDFK